MNVSLLITHVMQQIKLDYEYNLAPFFGQDDMSVVTEWMYAYMNMHTFLCTCTHLSFTQLKLHIICTHISNSLELELTSNKVLSCVQMHKTLNSTDKYVFKKV